MHFAAATNPTSKLLSIFESKRYDLIFVVTSIVAALIWNFASGRDLNWDQANYHFYLPYSLFDGRIEKDFVPASGQSYLNPLAYVPFYLMVMNGWPSLLIASILAAFHSVNLILVYYITKSLFRDESYKSRILATMGAVFAFIGPVYLMEIGTTFADISTTPFTLAAVLVLVRSNGETGTKLLHIALAGFLVGFASGLKLSNLVFFPALVLLSLLMQQGVKKWFLSCVAIGAGFLIGLAIAQGYWGYQLWKAFGNPLLPYFSNYFPSDVFPQSSANERFMITSFFQALELPFRMVLLRSYIYIENVAPDLRYAALTVITIFVAGKFAAERSKETFAKCIHVRRATALFTCFLLSFGLWLWTSSNGRYGLTVSLLCAPVIVAMMALSTERLGRVIASLGLILVFQIVHMGNGDLVWDRGPWTRTWYELKIPERLRTEPHLYIVANGNSLSFIDPFLAKESVFTNPIGQISFDFDREGGKRLSSLIAKHRGKIRILGMATQNRLDEEILKTWVDRMDTTISRLGFGVDGTDCESIITSGPENRLLFQRQTTTGNAGDDTDDPTMRRIITCRLYERPFELQDERLRVTRIAENVVQRCSKLFKPPYTVLERTKRGWLAHYPSTESVLVFDGDAIIGKFSRSSADIYLGVQKQWENGQSLSCEDLPRRPADVYNFY